jgi:hypothetical protein
MKTSVIALAAFVLGVCTVMFINQTPTEQAQHPNISQYLYTVFGRSPASQVKEAVVCIAKSPTIGHPGMVMAAVSSSSTCNLWDEMDIVKAENPADLKVGDRVELLKKHMVDEWVAIPQS